MVKPAKQSSEEKLHAFHKLLLDSDSFFGSKEMEKLAEKAGYRSMQAKGKHLFHYSSLPSFLSSIKSNRCHQRCGQDAA